nr:unnamed protein product [Callosobruchus chinensis]
MHKIFTGDFEICQHCDAAFRIKSSLDDHILKKHPDFAAPIFNRKIYECSNCKYKTVKKGLIKNRGQLNACQHCPAKFKNKMSLDDHIMKKHPDLIASVTSEILQCSHCAYKTTVKMYLNRHMLIHSNGIAVFESIVCKHCNTSFRSSQGLDNHIIQKHPKFIASVKRKIHKCTHCTYKTIYKYHFREHMLTHSSTECRHLITCQHCDTTYKTKKLLDDHVLKKHPDFVTSVAGKIYNCLCCAYKTTVIQYFNRHLSSHSSDVSNVSVCDYCGAQFKRKRSLDDHIVKKHPDFSASVSCKVHECPNCDYKTAQKIDLDRHILKHPEAVSLHNLISCKHCNMSFKSQQSLRNHIIRQHPDLMASVTGKIHECSYCTYKTSMRHMFHEHIIKHVWIHTSRTFSTCQHCTMTFRSRPSLYDHIIREHPQFSASVNRKIYECSYCNYKTINNFIFNEHTSIHTGDKLLLTCEHCEATFKKKQSLDEHIVRKHPDFIASIARKMHECPNCDYKTSKKDAFERHLLQHPKATDGSKVVSCHHCDTTYTSKERLGNHIIKEHPDLLASFKGRIYECLYCTYKTAIKHYLTTHTRMHCMDEVNVCKHCDATFKRKISLCDHIIKKHPDLRASFPYKIQECSHCDYKTARKSDLDRHMMKHLDKSSNRNLDTCLHCNATYKSKRYLHDHIVKKHPDFIATVTSKIYNCPRCTFKTTRKDELKKHILMESV